MAKYDGYALTTRLTGKSGEITLYVTTLFEVGDSINDVMADTRAKTQTEITALKNAGYLNNIQ